MPGKHSTNKTISPACVFHWSMRVLHTEWIKIPLRLNKVHTSSLGSQLTIWLFLSSEEKFVIANVVTLTTLKKDSFVLCLGVCTSVYIMCVHMPSEDRGA